ncbi:hypothetical protein [Stutzerimonas stutzeri]|uniref:hypothetical protein n=1 Tax=Stutzerimonas stutzeri TaxID=316 RepID=UPI00265D42A6|nr:hypothetical protein [Stutzerimonas stutzeri]MCF6783374.1 hypothetical protein [Stutzerimonas stutzeri]
MSKVLVSQEKLSRQPVEAQEVVERQRMIESMCLTWRHDFGLDKPGDCGLSSGMTDAEREYLRRQMGSLFDHHFASTLSGQCRTILTLTTENDALQAKVAALRAFANELVSAALCGGSFDGGDIQDAAVKHGLLSIEQREDECGAVCACSEYGFPATCYRKTALLHNNNRPVQGVRDE